MNRIPQKRSPEATTSQFDLAGVVLIAAPVLTDPVFGRSVCLVLEHTDEGSVGLVLNRSFTSDVAELWDHLSDGQTNVAHPPGHLNFGGPVSGPVLAIHDQELLAEAGNGEGVYVAAQVENLKKLTLVEPEHYRLFVGHAAWKAGQLEAEVERGFWYPVTADSQLVFAHESDMWALGMRSVGRSIVSEFVGADKMPASVLLN